ncbi:hypothetical protein RYH80_18635 [Halobaculum sp. MBLA0147]|uniref:hypothetical protein n=1 Tax=Halobaculum sp. MBLA0147 TaxID=3079934 RepID=UPI0035250B18
MVRLTNVAIGIGLCIFLIASLGQVAQAAPPGTSSEVNVTVSGTGSTTGSENEIVYRLTITVPKGQGEINLRVANWEDPIKTPGENIKTVTRGPLSTVISIDGKKGKTTNHTAVVPVKVFSSGNNIDSEPKVVPTPVVEPLKDRSNLTVTEEYSLSGVDNYYMSSGSAFIGNYETKSFNEGGVNITVVKSSKAENESLNYGTKRMRGLGAAFAWYMSNVTEIDIFVVPNRGFKTSVVNRRLDRKKSSFIFTGENGQFNSIIAENTHIATDHYYTPKVRWLTEAWDGYYRNIIDGYYASDNGSYHYNPDSLDDNTHYYESADLTSQSRSRFADYTKGRVLLGHIHYRIHKKTNGKKGITDVFRRLNTKRRVNYQSLKKAIKAETGVVLGAQFRRWMNGQGMPDPKGNTTTYALPKAFYTNKFDIDGDGVPFRTEHELGSDWTREDTDNDGLDDDDELRKYNTSLTQADTDGDGLDDRFEAIGMEQKHGFTLDPASNDTDNDGLSDGKELRLNESGGVSPIIPDSDSDGLTDGEEVKQYNTSPTNPDSDSDSLEDGKEITLSTDPKDPDSDGDGIKDGRETEGDGLTPITGVRTDPTAVDTDNDGMNDLAEIKAGRDPAGYDLDNDGINDTREIELGLLPNKTDTDGDGLSDPRELNLSTNATLPDTDDDGLEDGREVKLGTNPTAVDTDNDGLTDGEEVDKYGTDPTLKDTDGDGIPDGKEVTSNTDPLEKDSDDDGTPDGLGEGYEKQPTVTDTEQTATRGPGFTMVTGAAAVVVMILIHRRH